MKIHTGKPIAYWQSHISAKNPIYQNSKAVRDMVLLLMTAGILQEYCHSNRITVGQ